MSSHGNHRTVRIKTGGRVYATLWTDAAMDRILERVSGYALRRGPLEIEVEIAQRFPLCRSGQQHPPSTLIR